MDLQSAVLYQGNAGCQPAFRRFCASDADLTLVDCVTHEAVAIKIKL